MVVAIIPARGGSERIPKKNIKELAGHPLIAYAIASARRSEIFDGVYVSTECPEIQAISIKYGAEIIKRPSTYAQTNCPDFYCISHALDWLRDNVFDIDIYIEPIQFMILPPTNPFRTEETILRAWEQRPTDNAHTSLRSVHWVEERPEKMWSYYPPYIEPYTEFSLGYGGLPCDQPTQNFEPLLIQNGCVKISNERMVREFGNYTGLMVKAFVTKDYEGLDINTDEDWNMVVRLVETKKVTLKEPNLSRRLKVIN